MGHSYWLLTSWCSFSSGESHRCSLHHQGHWMHNLQMCQPLNKMEEHLHESCACPFLCLKSSVRHSWPLKWSQQCIVITVYHLRNNKTKKSRQVSRFSTQKTEAELPFQVQSQKTKQFPSTVILHICNPNTWEIKARGSAAQGQPRLHGAMLQTNKAQSCPCSMRGCFKSPSALDWVVAMEPEEMEAHGPSFSCCVVPNFFQFIHLVSSCLLPGEICPGPLLSFLSWAFTPFEKWVLTGGGQVHRLLKAPHASLNLWWGIWCPNCFLNTKWQRSRKSPPACLFCFNILKWSTAHAEKTYRVLHGFVN